MVVREASYVERLAYTRSQAAEALGISRSTLRRLLPYIETIEMPWGARLIPVDELERLVAERRRVSRPRLERATRGRPPTVAPEIVERICASRAAGASFARIAAELERDGVPTAHGGARWWPSTVRGILQTGSSSQARPPPGPARADQDMVDHADRLHAGESPRSAAYR